MESQGELEKLLVTAEPPELGEPVLVDRAADHERLEEEEERLEPFMDDLGGARHPGNHSKNPAD